MAAESSVRGQPKQNRQGAHLKELWIPVKATVRTAEGVREHHGWVEAIGDGYMQICFDHPLAKDTEITLVVEFKDRRQREIRFQYAAKVTSPTCASWYEVGVNFEDGVGISGKDAREMLSELFPEDA